MKKILMSIIVLFMVIVLVGCSCSRKEDKKTGENKIVNIKNEKLTKEQNLEGLKFINDSITYDGSNTKFVSTVTNTKKENQNLSWIKAIIKYEDSNKLEKEVELLIYFGESIPAGETRTTTTTVDTDLTKTLEVKYEIVK